jgi:hypothetical protein
MKSFEHRSGLGAEIRMAFSSEPGVLDLFVVRIVNRPTVLWGLVCYRVTRRNGTRNWEVALNRTAGKDSNLGA